jgi:hypothetical protein
VFTFIRNYFDEVDDAFPKMKAGQLKTLPIQIGNEMQQEKLNRIIGDLLKLNDEKSEAKLESKISQLEIKKIFCLIN